jgi:hypothetical protein
VFNEGRALVLVCLLLVGCTVAPTSPSPSPELSTTVRSLQPGQVVDGVPCLIVESPQYHIHIHLEILYDGVDVPVPAGIGIGQPWGREPTGFIGTGGCFAWMHVHDGTGVVHIATPEETSFTLGQLFEIWGQPLAVGSALGYQGSLVVLVNGQPIDGDPRAVVLKNLENIVLELGDPPGVPPPALYDFSTQRL